MCEEAWASDPSTRARSERGYLGLRAVSVACHVAASAERRSETRKHVEPARQKL